MTNYPDNKLSKDRRELKMSRFYTFLHLPQKQFLNFDAISLNLAFLEVRVFSLLQVMIFLTLIP